MPAGWRPLRAPTQQEVADLAGTDRMMTSRVMAALTAAGLLARTADPRSRRAKRVRPTGGGPAGAGGAGVRPRGGRAAVRRVDDPGSMALRAELRAVCATDPG
ncbi:MAG: winged helix DNA-binding protein [Micropruina sp.]|nr:MAG: winged helix DNA-binding protein [Micropruina sp.]